MRTNCAWAPISSDASASRPCATNRWPASRPCASVAARTSSPRCATCSNCAASCASCSVATSPCSSSAAARTSSSATAAWPDWSSWCGRRWSASKGNRLIADAGLPMAKAATVGKDAGLSGLEFGLAIPGTVGGAVWANAGAHGADVRSRLVAGLGHRSRWQGGHVRRRRTGHDLPRDAPEAVDARSTRSGHPGHLRARASRAGHDQ